MPISEARRLSPRNGARLIEIHHDDPDERKPELYQSRRALAAGGTANFRVPRTRSHSPRRASYEGAAFARRATPAASIDGLPLHARSTLPEPRKDHRLPIIGCDEGRSFVAGAEIKSHGAGRKRPLFQPTFVQGESPTQLVPQLPASSSPVEIENLAELLSKCRRPERARAPHPFRTLHDPKSSSESRRMPLRELSGRNRDGPRSGGSEANVTEVG